MSKQEKNKKSAAYDLMQDTQYLLAGLEHVKTESYALEDILAEFGSDSTGETARDVRKAVSLPVQPMPQPELEPVCEPEPELGAQLSEEQHPNVIAFPGMFPQPADADDTMVLIDLREYEEEPAEEIPSSACVSPVSEYIGEEVPAAQQPREVPSEPRALTMEDIVASTVDAVKAERKQVAYERSGQVKRPKKKHAVKRCEPRTDLPLPEEEQEPSPRELASFHKRRWQQLRVWLVLAVPVLLLMWIPWLMDQAGITFPYFSESSENAAICVLMPQLLLSIFCAGVFRAAWDELKIRQCTFYTFVSVANLVTLTDAATLMALPGRSALPPLGGVAGLGMVIALWGLKSYHRGMWETFRIAAMGEPACVVDRCESGIARGHHRREGFVSRANMESTAAQWQRLMLPLLLAASAVFAVLTSVGQGNVQDLIRCWSVMLCASCSLVCPMAYCVPLGRVAARLSRGGSAVAGQYGAAVLASASKIVASDTDLFPRAGVSINGLKLFGEKREQAISYAATLAVQGGGCMGRVFEEVCRSERIPYQPLEHFHVHDDNGLSGMIRGETVLVGTPMFMRHKAVRMPSRFPAKTAVCLAVDGELTAIFSLKYQVSTAVESGMRALGRNKLQLVLATRDGNITAKRLKQFFGTDGKAVLPEIGERLALSDPEREAKAPNALIYRDGFLPFVEVTALSRRLCQMIRTGNLLSMLGSVFGLLLAFYLTFVGRGDALSPVMLLVYLLLWVLPMLPLLISVDKM